MSKKTMTDEAAEASALPEIGLLSQDEAAEAERAKIEALQKLYEGKTFIYAGPNLHGGTLVSCSTFRGGLPPHVLKLVVQHPEIRALIVPVSDFSKTRQGVETKGSELHRLYEQLKAIRFRGEEAKA